MPFLMNSHYDPARGGHAPGDVRDAFLFAVETLYHAAENDPLPVVELRERKISFDALCGLLWNCRDQVPGIYRGMVEEMLGDTPIRGTYASAARALKGRFA